MAWVSMGIGRACIVYLLVCYYYSCEIFEWCKGWVDSISPFLECVDADETGCRIIAFFSLLVFQADAVSTMQSDYETK